MRVDIRELDTLLGGGGALGTGAVISINIIDLLGVDGGVEGVLSLAAHKEAGKEGEDEKEKGEEEEGTDDDTGDPRSIVVVAGGRGTVRDERGNGGGKDGDRDKDSRAVEVVEDISDGDLALTAAVGVVDGAVLKVLDEDVAVGTRVGSKKSLTTLLVDRALRNLLVGHQDRREDDHAVGVAESKGAITEGGAEDDVVSLARGEIELGSRHRGELLDISPRKGVGDAKESLVGPAGLLVDIRGGLVLRDDAPLVTNDVPIKSPVGTEGVEGELRLQVEAAVGLSVEHHGARFQSKRNRGNKGQNNKQQSHHLCC